MATAEIIKLFEEKRPVAVMAEMALERLLAPEELDGLFVHVAQEQYQRSLLFSSLSKLMSNIVLCREKSINAAYLKMQKELGASLNAVYTKLTRIEPGLSQALVRYSYRQLCEVTNELRSYEQSVLPGYRTRILDGNHLAATEHRLTETRNSTAAPLPGKALVALDPQREAIADLFPIEDGHAQERSALDAVIETIQRNDLWIADRNFCTLKFLYSIVARGGMFVIRHHRLLKGEVTGALRRIGKTETGEVFENCLKLPEFEGQTLTVRRIEVRLFKATRDGDKTMVILTNLSKDEATAVQVAEIYRKRWRIETAFQKLTTSLKCEINTLCYPRAALFAFSLACLAYNAVSMVLAGIRAEHGRAKTGELSFHYMAQEIAQAHDGMRVAVPPSYWDQIRAMSVADFVTRLRSVAQQIDFDYFRKSKRGPKKSKAKRKHNRGKTHVSTAKLLAARQKCASSAC